MNPFISLSVGQLLSEVREKRRQKSRLHAFSRTPVLGLHAPGEEARALRYPLPESANLRQRINQALLAGQRYVLGQQEAQGYWWEVLDTNTTLTSEFIMAAHFMELADPKAIQEACAYLLSQQQQDGGWTLYFNGPSDLSTTVEAYFALKLGGHPSEAPYMRRARELILEMGGILNARVFTKINLALFGQFPWRGIPAMPPQLVLLPRGFTFNIYEFSSWSRVVIVPLTVIMTYKPIIPIPRSAWVDELYVEPLGQRDYNMSPQTDRLSIESLFVHLDKTVKLLEHLPFMPFQKTALKKAERWILEHQDESGDWGGIFPAMVNSLMALRCLGYQNDHPVIRRGWKAVLNFQEQSDGELHQQSCISPVWDTAWYAIALCKSGISGDHPSIQKACRWLMDRQIHRPGDWKIKNPKGKPGGWAFEFNNDFFPDVDDTMAVLTALLLGKLPETDRLHESFSKGFRWLLSMQNPDGGWAAFEREINKKILNEIPFADLKSLLDPSTCDITGRVLEFLGMLGYTRQSRIVSRAIKFIKNNQHACGGWWGRWGVNYIYGTWAVLIGLQSVGEDMTQEYIQRAARWLKSIQNSDGGWGESCRSYEDDNFIGVGRSTPSQTAWAVSALMAMGEVRSLSIRRGIHFILQNQGEDGCWFEEEYTGTGFPKHFYLGYRGYKNYFSMLALSQFRELIV